MDDLDLYDEFGNYIGPERAVLVEKLQSGEDHGEKEDVESNGIGFMVVAVASGGSSGHMIVFPEEKEYYPSAESVYGREAGVLSYARWIFVWKKKTHSR